MNPFNYVEVRELTLLVLDVKSQGHNENAWGNFTWNYSIVG